MIIAEMTKIADELTFHNEHIVLGTQREDLQLALDRCRAA